MTQGAFTLALAAGMVATFNPCGFAMLPAYLAYFIGMEDDTPDTTAAVTRAIGVSGVITLGFVLVFAPAGWVLSWVNGVQESLSWVTIAIGAMLTLLGVAFLRGFELTIGLPKLNKGGGSRQIGSMLLFGISYAIASLSCTVGPFLAVTGIASAGSSSVNSLALFAVYAVGMGLVLSVLTVAVAVAHQGIVTRMRTLLRHVNKVSGVLLVVAGLYMVWYGYWETKLGDGGPTSGGPAEFFFGLNSDLSNWVQEVGPGNVGVVLGTLVLVAAIMSLGWRAANRGPDKTGAPTH